MNVYRNYDTGKRCHLRLLCVLLLSSHILLPVSHAQSDLASAEASFKYIATTLQTFRRTGRLANNPGVDGADLEHYLELLQTYYEEFQRDFGPDSAMCTFYRDPGNGRMTIEDRAEQSFSMLPGLAERNARYIAVDREFQAEMEDHFGSILLDAINVAKESVTGNQRLPSANFEQSVMINFLDTSCV